MDDSGARITAALAGVSVVPFKANADRRHHIPKQRHRATTTMWSPLQNQWHVNGLFSTN
jgi:hypothetical protein